MKKALSVFLTVLMLFSVMSIVACAQDEMAIVNFYNDNGEIIKTVEVTPGTILTPYVPEHPVKENTETAKYTFKGWTYDQDNELYYDSTLPVPQAAGTYGFIATYSEQNISERQTFWEFIESIFERLNLIFEYFATVFGW